VNYFSAFCCLHAGWAKFPHGPMAVLSTFLSDLLSQTHPTALNINCTSPFFMNVMSKDPSNVSPVDLAQFCNHPRLTIPPRRDPGRGASQISGFASSHASKALGKVKKADKKVATTIEKAFDRQCKKSRTSKAQATIEDGDEQLGFLSSAPTQVTFLSALVFSLIWE
jgi:hypothetical protein